MIAILAAAAMASYATPTPALNISPASTAVIVVGEGGAITATFCGRTLPVGRVSYDPPPKSEPGRALTWFGTWGTDFTFTPGLSDADKERTARAFFAAAARKPIPNFCEEPK